MGTRVSYLAEIKMKAIEMRLAGIPVKQILDDLISQKTVQRIMRKNGCNVV